MELKPCPFCGGEAEWEYREWNRHDETGDDGTGWARCTNRGCGAQIFDDRDSAIERWNRRAADQPAAVLDREADDGGPFFGVEPQDDDPTPQPPAAPCPECERLKAQVVELGGIALNSIPRNSPRVATCETHGHLWGPGNVCAFCKTPRAAEAPYPFCFQPAKCIEAGRCLSNPCCAD